MTVANVAYMELFLIRLVLVLRVEVQHDHWPEKSQRAAQWFAPADAARLVQEGELQRLLEGFALGAIRFQ